jgi:hypothetical protein
MRCLLYVVALNLPELAGRIRTSAATVALAVMTDVWSEPDYRQNAICTGLVTEQPSFGICSMLSVGHRHLFLSRAVPNCVQFSFVCLCSSKNRAQFLYSLCSHVWALSIVVYEHLILTYVFLYIYIYICLNHLRTP